MLKNYPFIPKVLTLISTVSIDLNLLFTINSQNQQETFNTINQLVIIKNSVD